MQSSSRRDSATSPLRLGAYVDLDRLLEKALVRELLTLRELRSLCEKAREIFLQEGNVRYVNTPVTVCGDIHGQFEDLMQLFEIGGMPPDTRYVFMGDTVDRGHHSIETVTLLVALKVRYRDEVSLLRGNHESRQISEVYGFYDECVRKFGDSEVWRLFTDLFDYFPIVGMIQGEMICMHGGLSPELITVDEIWDLDRIQEVPPSGPICDLLWSDPSEEDGWGASSRGAGWLFGPDTSLEFNRTNGLRMIARGHQMLMDGYDVTHDGRVATIFSAPNYCYRCNNAAGMMLVDDKLSVCFKDFRAAPRRASFSSKKLMNMFL